ncbi:hypothetical protein BDR07DRAFT_1418499 [Suillus spraguei]|nr:hypothetical protein BDR07DRAFT_1418499 [Suillus spraguei]
MTTVKDISAQESDLFLNGPPGLKSSTVSASPHHPYLAISEMLAFLEKMLQNIACNCGDAHREELKISLRNDSVGDGSEFVVLDETSKNERTYARHYGQSHYEPRAQLRDVFVRGERYSLCAVMTTDGSN